MSTNMLNVPLLGLLSLFKKGIRLSYDPAGISMFYYTLYSRPIQCFMLDYLIDMAYYSLR